MRRITLKRVHELVQSGVAGREGDGRPDPMPGKRWPTRIAWSLHFVSYKMNAELGKMEVRKERSFQYLGKPNRYRVLEVQKALQEIPPAQRAAGWIAEFDKSGIVASRVYTPGKNPTTSVRVPFFAYHPHSPDGDILNGFARAVHVKYIGGMRLYSEKKKLAQDAVDAYYKWYQTQFKRKLRRPKPVASAVIGGEKVEPEDAE